MLRRSWRFQQDNAPKHTGRFATEFLKKKHSGVYGLAIEQSKLELDREFCGIAKDNVERWMPKVLLRVIENEFHIDIIKIFYL